MKRLPYIFTTGLFLLCPGTALSAHSEEVLRLTQMGDMEHKKSPSHPMDHSAHGKMPAAILHPAEGAHVAILVPREGQIIKGDEVPVQFKLTKGKRGHHIHAYVDGELMGMFNSEHGTLTGIQPGHHILEVRVVAEDHQTELDATASIHFVVE